MFLLLVKLMGNISEVYIYCVLVCKHCQATPVSHFVVHLRRANAAKPGGPIGGPLSAGHPGGPMLPSLVVHFWRAILVGQHCQAWWSNWRSIFSGLLVVRSSHWWSILLRTTQVPKLVGHLSLLIGWAIQVSLNTAILVGQLNPAGGPFIRRYKYMVVHFSIFTWWAI